MHFRGALADHQRIGDLPVRFARSYERGHLTLARRQSVDRLAGGLLPGWGLYLWQRRSRRRHEVITERAILNSKRQFFDQLPHCLEFPLGVILPLEQLVCIPKRAVYRPQERPGVALLRTAARIFECYSTLMGSRKT